MRLTLDVDLDTDSLSEAYQIASEIIRVVNDAGHARVTYHNVEEGDDTFSRVTDLGGDEPCETEVSDAPRNGFNPLDYVIKHILNHEGLESASP